MHSLAFGTLRQFFDEEPSHALTQKQMDMTFDVMANSLVYWTQDINSARMFDDDARIFAMTSEGQPEFGPVTGQFPPRKQRSSLTFARSPLSSAELESPQTRFRRG